MRNQIRLGLARPVAVAVLLSTLGASSAHAEEPDRPRAKPPFTALPASVFCWPAAADGSSERRRVCDADVTDGLRPIDLKGPFKQFDAGLSQAIHPLVDGGTSSPGLGFLAELGALFDAQGGALSKSDLLLLRSTSVGPGLAGTQQTPLAARRRVTGIRDFGKTDQGGDWLLRPEVPAYLANEAAGLRIATQSVRELRGTVEPVLGDEEAPGFSFWTRAVGREDELGGVSGTSFQSQTDMTLMHAGVDYDRNALFGGSDRLHLGLMATYGNAVSDAGTESNVARASGKVTATRAGGYAAWYENETERTGLYADGWVGLTVLQNTVIGDDLPAESYFATAWAGSFETGYGWRPFGTALRIEPRLQVLYARYDQPAHDEVNGTRVAGTAGGASARLGVRLDQEWRFDNGTLLKPFAELNWRHDFTASGVAFDGMLVGAAALKDRFEFSIGLDAKIGNKWTMAFAVQTQQDITDYDGVEALVSVKCDW